MKRFLYIMLVVILILQSGGLLVFYRIELSLQQRRMKELLEKDDTRTEHFVISLSEFNRYRTSDNEIILNGERFDIKSFSISGKQVNLEAIHDSAEESLRNAVKRALNTGNTGFLGKILSLISLDYMFPVCTFEDMISSLGAKIHSYYPSSFFIHFPEIQTPPPRFI